MPNTQYTALTDELQTAIVAALLHHNESGVAGYFFAALPFLPPFAAGAEAVLPSSGVNAGSGK